MTLNVDWSSFEDCSVIEDWDDGHIPEHCSSTATRLVWRPKTFHSEVAARVQVTDHALPENLVDAICDCTLQENRPWGAYITMDQINQARMSHGAEPAVLAQQPSNDFHALAAQACAWYLHLALAVPSWMDDKSLPHFHGIAVWALPSDLQSQVPYHVDYAEQVRYQHNVVVLPLLAGTLHATRGNVRGGSLQVYPSLQHYETHGYKACKRPLEVGGAPQQTIDYRFNRLILMSGHLPHASTPVTDLPAQSDGTTRKRVMMGFNVFGYDVGSLVQAAPEHSAAWRRQIKLLRWQGSHNQPGSLTVSSVQNNPALRKFLVQAKRHRVRDEWRRGYLSDAIYKNLVEVDDLEASVTVEHLVQRIARPTSWPTTSDILQFLNEHCQSDAFRISERPVTLQTSIQK